MTTQTPATAKMEKWLRIRFRFFTNFWHRVRIRLRKKNTESCRSRLRHSESGPTSTGWRLQRHLGCHSVVPEKY